MEGARPTCAAKNGSEGGLAGRRSAIGPAKSSSKIGGGTVKDVSNMGRVPQTDHKAKGRPQPAVANSFSNGGQENGNMNPTFPSKDVPKCTRENPEVMDPKGELPQAKSGAPESNLGTDMSQTCEGGQSDESRSLKGQIEQTEVITRAPINESRQMQMESYKKDTQNIYGTVDEPLESRNGKGCRSCERSGCGD
ncbi:hypothetical protein NDU88_005691 [Pleurodeles waltl]|uniref:Uncharacterized protein n=1 Tax=Pleurodeles waltl TaxID=8319 RepID=A0AAV7TVI1_PLEWA|nr:hypothetical protein NDU88_005691 [Pleurodeles waltl]